MKINNPHPSLDTLMEDNSCFDMEFKSFIADIKIKICEVIDCFFLLEIIKTKWLTTCCP